MAAEEVKDCDETVLKQLKSKLSSTAGTKGSREWELKEFVDQFNDDWRKTPLDSFAKQLGKTSVRSLLKWDKLADRITVTRDHRSGHYTIIAKVTEKNQMNMHLINGTIASKESLQQRASKNVRSGGQTAVAARQQHNGPRKTWQMYRDESLARKPAYNRSFNVPSKFTAMQANHIPRQMSFRRPDYEPRPIPVYRPQVHFAAPNVFATGANKVPVRVMPNPPRVLPAQLVGPCQRLPTPSYQQIAPVVPVEFCKSTPHFQLPPPPSGQRTFIRASGSLSSPPPGYPRPMHTVIRRVVPSATPLNHPPGFGSVPVQRESDRIAADESRVLASPDTKRRANEKLHQAVKTRVEGCAEHTASPNTTEILEAPQVGQRDEDDERVDKSRCVTPFDSEEDSDIVWVPKPSYSSLDDLYTDIAVVTARFEKIKMEPKVESDGIPQRRGDEHKS